MSSLANTNRPCLFKSVKMYYYTTQKSKIVVKSKNKKMAGKRKTKTISVISVNHGHVVRLQGFTRLWVTSLQLNKYCRLVTESQFLDL